MRITRIFLRCLPLLTLFLGCDSAPTFTGPDELNVDPNPNFNFDFNFDFNLDTAGHVVGSGNVVTESRTVSGFHAVSISGVARLIIEQTGMESLTITAEDNLQPLLISEVVDGRLSLGFAANTQVSSTREIVFRLSVRELDDLSASGVVTVEASGIDTNALGVVVDGVSTVTAAGRSNRQDITVSGASTYDAADLESRFVTVDVSGASRAVIRVSEKLHARVSEAGQVAYIGDPEVTVDGPSWSVYKQ